MTPKPIGYTNHATRRLKERGISRSQVRWLLAKGRREVGETAIMASGYLGNEEASLVFTETSDKILILTVMWNRDRKKGE